jgi:hypothetical protein
MCGKNLLPPKITINMKKTGHPAMTPNAMVALTVALTVTTVCAHSCLTTASITLQRLEDTFPVGKAAVVRIA